MRKFLYISFEKNSFLVSDGESPANRFEIYNFEDCTSSLTHVEVRNKKTKQKSETMIAKNLIESNYRNVPYVSVFQSVFNDLNFNVKKFQCFIREKFPRSFFKRNAFVAIPDDSIVSDQRCVTDFFVSCGCINEAYLIRVGMSLSKTVTSDTEPYCALTKSARTVTLSMVIDGGFIDQMFLDKEHDDLGQIKALINSWNDRFKILRKIPVFLYGENIEAYSPLGTTVTNDVLLDNMKYIFSKMPMLCI